MRHERQVELLRRLQGVDAPRPGPLAPASMHNPASAYTSPERFADEVRVLFRGQPVLVALSCELREPGRVRHADRRRRAAGRGPPARRVGAGASSTCAATAARRC